MLELFGSIILGSLAVCAVAAGAVFVIAAAKGVYDLFKVKK